LIGFVSKIQLKKLHDDENCFKNKPIMLRMDWSIFKLKDPLLFFVEKYKSKKTFWRVCKYYTNTLIINQFSNILLKFSFPSDSEYLITNSVGAIPKYSLKLLEK